MNTKNHMKRQKCAVIVGKYLEINMLTMKVRGYWDYTCEYRGALHSICNLKYSISKEISVKFHNGSNYN